MNLLRLLPRFAKAYRELDTLAARESWSRCEIESWQLDRLNAIWSHAVDHVPYYRRFAADRRLPARFSSLEEFQSALPVLPRAEFKTRSTEFLSDSPAPGAWHVSSGSSGVPTPFYWGHDAHLEVLRCRYRMYMAWSVDIFDRTAFLWGNGALHTPGFSGSVARVRRRAEDRLRNRLRLSAYHLAPADLRSALRRLAAFRPATLYAYSTAAYLLAKEAEAEQFRSESLKLCSMSGEPAFPHMIAAVERAFGVPAVVEYGATECALIAGEAPDRKLRVRDDVVFVETRPVADGQHEILLSVLTNESFPLLRYAIGDFTDEPIERPSRGFAILKNVGGRENDLVMTGTGRILHPLRFDFVFGFEWADVVRRYVVHQAADGATTVTVEVLRAVQRSDVTALERELCDLLEGYPVTLQIVASLPERGHKHRWTTSELLPNGGTS